SGSRIQSFFDSLTELIARARDLAKSDKAGKVLPLLRLFAYGFGFDPPQNWFSDIPSVRDLLEVPGLGSPTVSIDQLVDKWEIYEHHLKRLADDMFGTTPLTEAVDLAVQRFDSELTSHSYAANPLLFILSDGEPTRSFHIDVVDRLKQRGILVVS